jgi:hypothetical protein
VERKRSSGRKEERKGEEKKENKGIEIRNETDQNGENKQCLRDAKRNKRTRKK